MIHILLLILSFQVFAQTRTFLSYGRLYRLKLAPQAQSKRPLVVLLHGCRQNSQIMMEKSFMDDEAEQRNFHLLTPEQPISLNPSQCWNWFLSEQQIRSPMTEMGGIMATIDRLFNLENIDREKIFVAGLSAGGALAHTMMVCYPDYFKGAAMHSGLAYKEAENLTEGRNILRLINLKKPDYLGEKAAKCSNVAIKNQRLQKIIIIQGEDDKSVIPKHAKLISDTNWVMRDWQDDGKRNSSLKITESMSTESVANGYVVKKSLKTAGNFSEMLIYVDGLKHAWGGGENFEYFDPHAPSSNDMILDFFGI